MESKREKTLYYQLLNGNVQHPYKAYAGSAAYDLAAPRNVVIPRETLLSVPLDIIFDIPKNCYGRIALRSGLAKEEIDVRGGVIDNDYRGNVHVLLRNESRAKDFRIKKGDRLVQFILEKYQRAKIEKVERIQPYYRESTATETERERGSKGFGSSGLNEILI